MTDSSEGFKWPSAKEAKYTWMGLAIGCDFNMLSQYLDVIRNHRSRIQNDIKAYINDLEKDGNVPQEIYEAKIDEMDLAKETERVMYACFGISVFSVIENTLRKFCMNNSITVVDRADWGIKRNAIEQNLNVDFKTFPGIDEVTELRLLSNCFKHNGGRVDSEFKKQYGTTLNNEIKYENKDWKNLVLKTQQFLNELAQKNVL